eukprot:2143706-Lingulodinium_polyedra.AAC.1
MRRPGGARAGGGRLRPRRYDGADRAPGALDPPWKFWGSRASSSYRVSRGPSRGNPPLQPA